MGPWFANEDPNENIKEEDHEDEDGNNTTAMKVTVEEDFSTVPTQVKNSQINQTKLVIQ